MRLILRVLRVEVRAGGRDLGFEIAFTRGLNIIRADNSSGKSTALQSIIYALGLEGMLSARREIPLPHAMTDRVAHAGTELPVEWSRVSLELENSQGSVISVRRHVKHPRIDTSLIRVWSGPLLSAGADYPASDYFVRRPGAAQREAGFHRFLAEFLGWNLPAVTRIDGTEGRLYLECIFPFFYVEQKHGWSGVQARIPTYFGIREVGKRAAEYVLDLEIFQRVLERQRLMSARGIIEASWQEGLRSLSRVATEAGLVLLNGQPRISDGMPDGVAVPMLYLEGAWHNIDDAIGALDAVVGSPGRAQVRSVSESSSAAEQELPLQEQRLAQVLARLAAAFHESGALVERRDELELRVEALAEDLQRHKDGLLLEDLGSDLALSLLAEHICPTCHQDVADGSDISTHAMTAAENIEFVSQRLQTFQQMYEDVRRVLVAANARVAGLRAEATDARRVIRSLKDALTTANSVPSVADITRIATQRDRLERLIGRRGELLELREELQATHRDWLANREATRALGDGGLTRRDEGKLALVEQYLRAQLARYHFGSLSPNAVDVSRETYRPANEGFDLGFDLSASDMIRVIWSYLFALMKVSGEESGNHPGLLILDEPRQQETARESYEQLLHQASEESETTGAQIIFATSEGLDGLLAMLTGRSYNLVAVPSGEKMITASIPSAPER